MDPTTASLDYLVGLAGASSGPCSVKKVLAELQPDEDKGDSVVSVCRWKRDVRCEVANCDAVFAERKELYRHVRVAHSLLFAGDNGYGCGTDGCHR